MKTPTPGDVRTAIEVLKKLGERLNAQATHSVMQMPDSRLGDDCAGRIEVRSIEQITRIETVAAQLESWREELQQQRRHHVTNQV